MILFLIALAALSYALFDIFAAKAGGKIDANLSAVIFNGLGVILPIASYVVFRFIKGAKIITATTSGIIYSALAGITIALFSVLLIKIFEKGSGLAYVMPLIYGGSIAITAFVGWFFFKEQVSLLQGIGVATVIAGIIMVILSKA